MIEPRGTGTLYQLAMMRLFGLQRPDDIVSVSDIFSRPELWALHQGSLWVVPLAGPAAGGVGFRSRIGVTLPSTTKQMLSIVELIRITGSASQLLQVALSGTDATAQLNIDHRDLRRANNGISGLQNGIATRSVSTNLTAIPSPEVVTETLRSIANETRDFPVSYVLEPGSALWVQAAADNTAMTCDVTFYGRERSATDEEIQM